MATRDPPGLRRWPRRSAGKTAAKPLERRNSERELVVEDDQSREPVANPDVWEPQSMIAFRVWEQHVPAVGAREIDAGVVDIRSRRAHELRNSGLARRQGSPKRQAAPEPDHGVRARRQARVAEDETSPPVGELCKPRLPRRGRSTRYARECSCSAREIPDCGAETPRRAPSGRGPSAHRRPLAIASPLSLPRRGSASHRPAGGRIESYRRRNRKRKSSPRRTRYARKRGVTNSAHRRFDEDLWRTYGVRSPAASANADSRFASSNGLARDGCRRRCARVRVDRPGPGRR